MSKYFKESNFESTFNLFNKRLMYKGSFIRYEKTYPNLVDFKAEKILYGRVNRAFNPIVLPRNSKKLKSFSGSSSTSKNFKALNFVVDAFTDLQQQFDKCRNINKIATDDPYLSSLKVHRAYADPYVYYDEYTTSFTNLIKGLPAFNKNKISNLDYVIDSLYDTMKISGKLSPFTFPGFIKNKKTPINISGLAVEIANLNTDNDDQKINQFIGSVNWEFYVNTCKSYGFMVDSDVPWRLVADIGSSVMIEYAKRYGMNSTNEIINSCYQYAHSYYYNIFIDNILNLYNTLKPNIIINSYDCNSGTKTQITRPKEYQIDKLKNDLGASRIIEMYCNLRFLEEENYFTEQQKLSIIRDITQISKAKDERYAIRDFENLINKTFDYQGSLGYYIRQQRARIENIT